MKKLFVPIIIIFVVLLSLVGSVYAGGCCYQYFNSVDGIAGVKDAQINVGFVDPQKIPSPLANQRIEVHIVSAIPGQFCKTDTEKTDEQGRIALHCASHLPGSISVYFTAPDLSVQANEAIKSVSKSIIFTADPHAPVISRTPTTTPTTTVAPSETQPTPTPYDIELQKRIDSLEEKVNAQEKQVNRLQEIINAILDFFKIFFG